MKVAYNHIKIKLYDHESKQVGERLHTKMTLGKNYDVLWKTLAALIDAELSYSGTVISLSMYHTLKESQSYHHNVSKFPT